MRWLLNDVWAGSIYSMDTLGRGMVHDLGRMAQDGVRFHHMIQNSSPLITDTSFISVIFYLMFLDCD